MKTAFNSNPNVWTKPVKIAQRRADTYTLSVCWDEPEPPIGKATEEPIGKGGTPGSVNLDWRS